MKFDDAIILIALAGIGLAVIKTPVLRDEVAIPAIKAVTSSDRYNFAMANVLRLYPAYGGWEVGQE